uniref:Reverse transcriptase Ty1/copia-type domain-containing protein n=1 Tax=Solanum lycopersicum TaxID=4081 RepID=A0A3Q7H8J3_SOLLC
MSGVKYEVAKFNGDSGFSTWQRRMKDLLIQQESMIDEVAEHEEQPDEIVEQGEQLGDNTEQMEYPEEEQSPPLRRSERQRIESTKYPSSEFSDNNFIILLLYVDDMLIVGQDKELIAKLKKDLSKSFDMKDLGPAQQILGMRIVRERTKRKLWLSQEKYIERVLLLQF